MQALFHRNRLAKRVAGLQRHKLAIWGLGGLAAASLLASGLLILHVSSAPLSALDSGHLSFRHVASQQPDSRWDNSPWAGSIEEPLRRTANGEQTEQPLTSASYTSGFDEKAAGLGPLPRPAQSAKSVVAGDPMACPNDLNCSFRPARAGGVAIRHRFPAANTASNGSNANNILNPGLLAVAPKAEQPAKATQQGQPNGFALLTNFRFPSHLPTHLPTKLPPASTLLKPFTFVSNTVVGFVKKL